MKNATSLPQVNKALQAKYPLLELVKGNGYFYVHSNDDAVGLQLAGLYSTSISIASIKHQSVEKWIESVELVLSDWERYSFERTPVKFD